MRLVIIALILTWTGFSFGQSFQTGNNFEATELTGRADVSCRENGQYDRRLHYCRAIVLDPAEFQYFVDKQVDADQVNLYSTRADGKQITKRKSFDSEKGRTSSRVNLWIDTVLQNPLLKYGTNEVRFKFKKDGKTVKEGQFTSNVTKGQPRRCQYRYYTSFNMNDCKFSSSFCNRYFRDENYCN